MYAILEGRVADHTQKDQ